MLFLPQYSPDLDPIEMAFSKLKAHLRNAATPQRAPSMPSSTLSAISVASSCQQSAGTTSQKQDTGQNNGMMLVL
jgi:hypothetical protein